MIKNHPYIAPHFKISAGTPRTVIAEKIRTREFYRANEKWAVIWPVKMGGNMDGPDMKEVTRDNARGITPTDFDAIMYSSIEACPFACCLKRKLTGSGSKPLTH